MIARGIAMPSGHNKTTTFRLKHKRKVGTPGVPACFILFFTYFPNQPMGRPDRSTQTLFTCV